MAGKLYTKGFTYKDMAKSYQASLKISGLVKTLEAIRGGLGTKGRTRDPGRQSIYKRIHKYMIKNFKRVLVALRNMVKTPEAIDAGFETKRTRDPDRQTLYKAIYKVIGKSFQKSYQPSGL